MGRRKLRRTRSATVIAVAAITAAAVLANTGSATAASVGSVRSWSAGTMSPGQSKTYTWNNANSDMYQVGTGAVRSDDPDVPCLMEVSRQWYRRAAGGARQFMLTIKNVDSASCAVTVYLASITADRSGNTGVLNPGQVRSWRWNNANPNSFVYHAAVTPSAPASGTCQLEVNGRNRAVPDGEQEYLWFVRNVGSVACEGQWRLGWFAVGERTLFPDDDPPTPPGRSAWLRSPVQDPFRVYVFGLLPVATDEGNCDLGPIFLRMEGDPAAPTADTRTEAGWQVVGSVPCVVRGVTKAYIG